MLRSRLIVALAVTLIAGCGGSSDGGDSDTSGEPSAGDTQYVDPFQKGACLSKREIQQKIFIIASQVQNPERKQRAIHAVGRRAC